MQDHSSLSPVTRSPKDEVLDPDLKETPFDLGERRAAIRRVKTDKVLGINSIPGERFGEASDKIASFLTKSLNEI